MKLVLAEKPSVAQSIAKVLGAAKREDGYLEGNGYVVSWCVGHLVELAQPEVYDAKYSKWAYADLPIFPMGYWNSTDGASTFWCGNNNPCLVFTVGSILDSLERLMHVDCVI